MVATMATWEKVTIESGELAERVRARFDRYGLGVLATLRRDGSPRLSGIEPFFGEGELWLGMMPDSRKGRDLQRDPRLELHAASTDKQVAEGDAKVSGRAVEVRDDGVKSHFLAAFAEHTGVTPPTPFTLFRVDVSGLSFLRPESDHLLIEWWDEGSGLHRVERS
jgi:hypothetical protein